MFSIYGIEIMNKATKNITKKPLQIKLCIECNAPTRIHKQNTYTHIRCDEHMCVYTQIHILAKRMDTISLLQSFLFLQFLMNGAPFVIHAQQTK